MKFIKLDLLTLLISLFLFASCEKTATIGLEVDPTSAVQGDLVDTLTVSSRTVLDENASTIGLARYPLGYLNDPIFGKTDAGLALAVNVPSEAYSFGTQAVIDSAVLSLSFGTEFYGDSTATYNFEVRQLAANLHDATSYLNNINYTTGSALLGNKTGKVYPTTPFKVMDVVPGKADTLKSVPAQIRIKLDNSFIQNNIVNLPEASLKTNARFASAFKGLFVQVNKTGTTGIGGVMFMDFAGTKSNLTLYYKKQNATTTTNIDTVAVDFPINSDSGPVASSVKHDYAGTPIAAQLSNPTQQYAVTYLQPLIGIRNKIAFPYLDKFVANAGKIVVNKAELIIDLSTGSNTGLFNPAARLSLYRYDIAEKRQNVPDINTGFDLRALDQNAFGGFYDPIKKQYIFTITSYIQDLMSGKLKDYGTFIAPTPAKELLITPSLSSASRSVIGSFKKNPIAGDNVIKLNIYYTKIN